MISSNERKYDRLRLNGPCVLRTAYYIKSPYCVLRTEISSFAMTVPTDIAGQVIDSTNEDISSTQYAVGSGQYVFCSYILYRGTTFLSGFLNPCEPPSRWRWPKSLKSPTL